MAGTKRLWVKLSVPSTFLSTLPEFAHTKSRVRKVATDDRKSLPAPSLNPSKGSSPAPSISESTTNNSSTTLNTLNQPAISNFKINSGLKESSTSGLVMNSISNGLYALDKSGKPCKKWVKKPTQFKTFSGFKVKYISWKHKNPEKSQKSKTKEEAKAAIKQESSPPMSISATPDLRSEA